MKCAIYGAGSLGTILGAYITKGGVDIELVNRNVKHVEALRENGAHVTGTVDFRVPVKAILPDEMVGPYDVILLLTKQLYNHEVVSFLKPLLADDGVICTLQNGIPEPSVAEVVGKDHTLGCVVEWGATMTSPGECQLTSDEDGLSFHMGRSADVPYKKFLQVKNLLEMMCRVDVEEDLAGTRWTKLLINSTFSGLGTVMGGTFGDVAGDPVGRKVAVRCIKEILDVGHAAGVEFADVQGINVAKLFDYRTPAKKMLVEKILPVIMKKHKDIYPSMLQDLVHGKKCEIDAINGVLCDWGRKVGVPTPVNDRIVEVVKKEQAGELAIDASNIHLFDDFAGEARRRK